MQVVLFQPEIPPNTGNIARLCVATQTPLHLIKPLGFSLEDKYLKRAGLDYWPYLAFYIWPDWDHFEKEHTSDKFVLFSKKANKSLYSHQFRGDEMLIFGPETRGLPEWMLKKYSPVLKIPMWGKARSLNLSTAVGICLYEAYRQTKDI